jgi:hypothetical protein
MSVSLRQLARIIGVSDTAVRKALKSGVFGDAVQRDGAGEPGVLDVGAAITAWERSGRALRGSRESRRDEPPAAPSLPVLAPATPDTPSDDNTLLGEDDDILPATGAAPPSLVEAQRMAMLERHRRLKLENDEREGALIVVERATAAAFEFARVLRENVMNVPGRIGAELAAESDAARVHVLLEAALREALETTANALEAPAASTTPASTI